MDALQLHIFSDRQSSYTWGRSGVPDRGFLDIKCIQLCETVNWPLVVWYGATWLFLCIIASPNHSTRWVVCMNIPL